jgi:hypothetical protein
VLLKDQRLIDLFCSFATSVHHIARRILFHLRIIYFGLLMSTKIDIMKFDVKISFAIWQIQIKSVLTQLCVQKSLQPRPTHMADDK